MDVNKLIETLRYPVILLFSIGVSSVGSWIALNLIVLPYRIRYRCVWLIYR